MLDQMLYRPNIEAP